jgi:hypothetical protein
MQEPAEVPIAIPTTPASSTIVPPVVVPVKDAVTAEGFTLLQKGLFFAVILGCVAVYLRMSGSKKEKRFQEKSMA